MKYEIITDSEDLLVLTVNSRVIEVSHDIKEIVSVLTLDYAAFMQKRENARKRDELAAQPQTKENKTDKTPNGLSIGKLLQI